MRLTLLTTKGSKRLTKAADLQQTPATSAKVMLKVFAQPPGSKEVETHVFSFTSPTVARPEADAIKDALSAIIQASKTSNGIPTAPGGGSAAPAAMAIASAVATTPGQGGETASIYDDAKLGSDIELQQSLLKSDPGLSKMFMESLRTKPQSISNSQFTSQFWAPRIHLLRAHAIEKKQTRGAYNVLSSIKFVTVDNTPRLSITKEQIQLIFSQHPLVKRVYDENVPKLSEEKFWSRFFQSRLFKKLKGERLSESDAQDQILDKYLRYEDDTEMAKRLLAAHVPHIIDVEGNEENHSQRKGNQADFTMRPASADRVPIIRTLNNLSEKILSHVAPSDIDPSAPIGVDEETFNELALRDLQGDAEERRIILNIKDQSRFFSSDKGSDSSSDAPRFAKKKPDKVLSKIRADIAQAKSNTNLASAIGVNEDSDSSEDEAREGTKEGHVGSHRARAATTAQLLSAIAEQRLQSDDSADGFSNVQSASTSGLSPLIFDRVTLTHATTTEFLQHFWSAFLSGDASRADEISRGIESLDRAMDRIKAIAEDAETERQKEVDKRKRHIKEYQARTGKKLKEDFSSIVGGEKAVNELLAPTIKTIGIAHKVYRKALKEQVEDGD